MKPNETEPNPENSRKPKKTTIRQNERKHPFFACKINSLKMCCKKYDKTARENGLSVFKNRIRPKTAEK
jgi:hypothetical protein